MNLSRLALLFLGGYGVVAVILIIVFRLNYHDWRSGFIMLGLSAPVTVIYFFVLAALARLGFQSRAGILVAGALCATFPAFFGFFPIYFFRLKYAILLLLAQLTLLALTAIVFSRIDFRWLRVFRG
jgi:hypothetical protein